MHRLPVEIVLFLLQLQLCCSTKDCPHPCVCHLNAGTPQTLTVDCRNQDLYEIPLGIPPTTSHLDVSHNSIQFVRAVDLQKLPVLIFLQLHTNAITQIEPGAFQALTTLEGLYLHNNRLSSLRSGTFAGLSNLQTLSLYNNYIEDLDPSVFRPLDNIVNIDLMYNSLESISTGTFSNFSRLHNLNLQENFISRIEERAVSNLPFLLSLSLGGNQLKTIPRNAWKNVPFLRFISLTRNRLECGCGALWLRQWFIDRRLRGPIFCESPPNLRGMDLLLITPENFCQFPKVSINQSEPLILFEGMPLQLKCLASGAPLPTIMWSRRGMTFDSTNSRLQLSGNSLTIDDVMQNDTGRYFCCATSSAGTAAASIEVVVVVNQTIPVTIATTGDTVQLDCYNGTLPSSVKSRWRFNGTYISFSGRYAMGEMGELIIFNVQARDMGQYVCELGDGVRLFRELELQALPVITISPEGPCDTPDILSLTTGDSVRLRCEATGVPVPRVTWTRPNRRPISGVQFATVVLVPPSLSDAGLHTCTAENVIGRVVQSITIRVMAVLTPGSSVFRQVILMKGDTAILNCSISEGVTTTSFSWTRDDRQPLSEQSVLTSGGTLIIPNLQITDISIYLCRATTPMGIAEIEYGLILFTPPQITLFCPQPRSLQAFTGSTLKLNCTLLEGNPNPIVTWVFGNRTIQSGGRYSITNRAELLTISALEVGDSGVYTCFATNRVGRKMYRYLLEVKVTPRLFFRRQPSGRLNVNAGVTARMPCQGNENPRPSISWFKMPLQLSSKVTQIFPSSRTAITAEELLIFNATVTDEGFYYCVIENELGRKNSTSIHLSVWVPPRLTDGLATEYLVVEGSDVIIPCSGTGDPKPTLNWMKNSRVLPLHNRQRIRSDGSLEMFRVRPSDAGQYVCRIANAGGEVYLTVNVVVRAIPRARIVPTDPGQLDVGMQLTLFCSNMGQPRSALEWITWRRDGNVLRTAQNVVVMDNGELILSNLQESDTGNYSCKIASYAGSSEAFIFLTVENPLLSSTVSVSPPSITSPTRSSQTLAVGQTAHFVCLATGFPKPTVTWQKNGGRVPNLRRISIMDGILTINMVRVTDEADYTCIASNEIGMLDSVTFNLSVASRPTIQWPPRSQVLSIGQTLTLRCKASGSPQPSMQWQFNHNPLVQGGCISINQTRGTLTLCNATLSSSGTYTCLATNIAGIAEYSVPVLFLEKLPAPPNITTAPKSMIIEAGQPLTLDCIPDGNPQPNVTWFKNGIRVVDTCLNSPPSNCTVLDAFSVYIHVTTETDSGTYTCVAKNSAGVSTYEVHVLVEPKSTLPFFTRFPTILSQTQDFVQIACAADGSPPPDLVWLTPDFRVVGSNSTNSIYASGGTLFITNAQQSDSGTYTCQANNTAGVIQACIPVWIGEEKTPATNGTTNSTTTPRKEDEVPRFLHLPQDVSTLVGLSIAVPCSATADANFIIWTKNNQPLYQDDSVTVATNGTLIVRRAKVNHSGVYTCMAIGDKGISMAIINIHMVIRPEPPYFLFSPRDLLLSPGSDFSLPCRAESVSDDIIITSWYYNGEMINKSCGRYDISANGSLQVYNAQYNDTGEYSCQVSNIYGSVVATATVTITHYPINRTHTLRSGGTLLLHCTLDMGSAIEGTLVMWMRDHQPLSPSPSLLPFQSMLFLLNAHAELEGEYTCFVNELWLNFYVDIIVPPTIVNIHLLMKNDSTINMDCKATGRPSPQITWYYKGAQLTHSRHYSPRHNGTLTLHPPLTQLAGEYRCLATNAAGLDEKTVPLSSINGTLTIQY